MTDPTTALAELAEATAQYRAAKAAYEQAREQVVGKVVAALKAKAGPAEVARQSPFTDTYVRAIARERKVPPARPGIKKRTKA